MMKVCFTVASSVISNINTSSKWSPNGITVAGGHGQGDALNQLSYPSGVYVDDDQTIYVADQYNHRVVEWRNGETSGKIVAGGNGAGERNNQLKNPTSVLVDKTYDSLIICDQGNQRVVRWARQNSASGEIIISNINCVDSRLDKDGYMYVLDFTNHAVKRYGPDGSMGFIVAGSNRAGYLLHQFDKPYFICLDEEGSIYVSDNSNHRVMKWMKGAKQGLVVAGGQGRGSSLTHLSSPRGIIVDQLGTIYVADLNNHRIMRWCKGTTQGTVVVGANTQEDQANQLKNPRGLAFDQQGNLYVVDHTNHQVQRFNCLSSNVQTSENEKNNCN